nr:uncharacterized protein LOC112735938 [Arachis hypogaea]
MGRVHRLEEQTCHKRSSWWNACSFLRFSGGGIGEPSIYCKCKQSCYTKNVKRSSMLKLRQAAWLFHHSGLDASALLFADEVDMENLLVTGQVTVLVVGEDILTTTGEVGSQCTILTDNYCEDAYDLLQNSVLKKLLETS